MSVDEMVNQGFEEHCAIKILYKKGPFMPEQLAQTGL